MISVAYYVDVIVVAITLAGLAASRLVAVGAAPLGEWRGTFGPGTPSFVDLKGRTFVHHGEISPHAH